jgi:hypothetical protein
MLSAQVDRLNDQKQPVTQQPEDSSSGSRPSQTKIPDGGEYSNVAHPKPTRVGGGTATTKPGEYPRQTE